MHADVYTYLTIDATVTFTVTRFTLVHRWISIGGGGGVEMY